MPEIFPHRFTCPQQEQDIPGFIEKNVLKLSRECDASKICVSMPKWLLDYFKAKYIRTIKNTDFKDIAYFCGARIYLNYKNEVAVFHEDFEIVKKEIKIYTIN